MKRYKLLYIIHVSDQLNGIYIHQLRFRSCIELVLVLASERVARGSNLNGRGRCGVAIRLVSPVLAYRTFHTGLAHVN